MQYINVNLAFTALTFGVAASSAHAFDASCVILPKSSATTVSSSKGTFEAPVRLDNCQGVRITSGSASVCFVTASGARTCSTLRAGESVSVPDGGFSASTSLSSIIVGILRGTPETLPGQTRAPPGILGFPYGALLGLEPTLAISSANRRISSFEVFDVSHPTTPVAAMQAGDAINLKMSQLSAETGYRWVANVDGQRYSGRFLIAGYESRAIRGQVKAVADDTTMSPAEKYFLIADLLDQEGFIFERDKFIERLRAELPSE